MADIQYPVQTDSSRAAEDILEEAKPAVKEPLPSNTLV